MDAPAHSDIYQQEAGVHAAVEGDDEHHEKKPVLKKVKDKVKKIKDTISKKKHGHDSQDEEDGCEEDDEETLEADPEVHGAPMYESTATRNVQEPEGVALGDVGGALEEDPAVPKPGQVPAGEGEVGMSPVLSAFQAMAVSDRPEERAHDEGEKKPSYTDKISSTASAAVTTVYEKVAEKLRPGEEDRALCEVISETIHKREDEAAEERERVMGSDGARGGKGLVEQIRGAVTSLLGGGRGGGGGGSGAPPPLTGGTGKGAGAAEGARQESDSRKQEEIK